MTAIINAKTGKGVAFRIEGEIVASPSKLARYKLLMHRPQIGVSAEGQALFAEQGWMVSEASTGGRMLARAHTTQKQARNALAARFATIPEDRIAAVIAAAECLNPEWRPK